MCPTSDFSNGFSDGLTVRNLPLAITPPGKVVFLNNSSVLAPGSIRGADTNKGTYRQPKATLAGAQAASSASVVAGSGSNGVIAGRGDIIMVMPNHAETATAATGVGITVSGIQVIGVAAGDIRPTFTSSTATSAVFAITGSNSVVKNCIFTCGIASQTAVVKVTALNVRLEDCRFGENSAQPVAYLVVGSAANDSNRFEMYNCDIYAPTANATNGIVFAKAQNNVRLKNIVIHGDFSNAAISNSSSAQLLDFLAENVSVRQAHAGAYGLYFQTTNGTGRIRNSTIACDTQANAASVGTIICDGVDWSDISTANAQAVPANTPLSSGTTVAAQQSTLTTTKGLLPFVIRKTLLSSNITTSGVTILTANSTGNVYIAGYQLSTDGTGLATGTNFTLTTVGNTYGSGVVATEAVSSLGAGVTLANTALTTGKPFTVEASQTVVAKCTSSSCTGSGNIAVDFLCYPLASGALVS